MPRDRSEYWKARSAERRKDPEYRAKQSEVFRAWQEKNGNTPERLARKAEQMRGYAKAHGTREHHQARRKVRHEIEMGRLVRQPCEVCGGVEKIHAHHDDYTRPLSVRWLCQFHHHEHHAKATGGSQ